MDRREFISGVGIGALGAYSGALGWRTRCRRAEGSFRFVEEFRYAPIRECSDCEAMAPALDTPFGPLCRLCLIEALRRDGLM